MDGFEVKLLLTHLTAAQQQEAVVGLAQVFQGFRRSRPQNPLYHYLVFVHSAQNCYCDASELRHSPNNGWLINRVQAGMSYSC